MTQSLVNDETVFPTKYGLYYVTVTFPVCTLFVCLFASRVTFSLIVSRVSVFVQCHVLVNAQLTLTQLYCTSDPCACYCSSSTVAAGNHTVVNQRLGAHCV